jgi:hypothetical protein
MQPVVQVSVSRSSLLSFDFGSKPLAGDSGIRRMARRGSRSKQVKKKMHLLPFSASRMKKARVKQERCDRWKV